MNVENDFRRWVYVAGISDEAATKLANAIATADAEANSVKTYFQEYLNQSTTTLTVTKNGGILPDSDDDIAIMYTQGFVPSTGWTANRAVQPNVITLTEAPDPAADLLLMFSV